MKTAVRRFDCILFDADNTIFDYVKSEAYALKEAFRIFGLPYSPGTLSIYAEVNEPLWKLFERGEIDAEYIRDRRFGFLLERLGLSGDSRALNETYLEALGSQTWEMEGAKELLESLQGGYRLGIITNGLSRVQRKRFSLSRLARFFSAIVVSEETGFSKPDPRIFSAAMAMMGNPPKGKVLFVGDSLSADIAGAIAAGIPCCWFDRGRPELSAEPVPDFRIHELRMLPGLLAQLRRGGRGGPHHWAG
jgi:2-haloacid dehalogenase